MYDLLTFCVSKCYICHIALHLQSSDIALCTVSSTPSSFKSPCHRTRCATVVGTKQCIVLFKKIHRQILCNQIRLYYTNGAQYTFVYYTNVKHCTLAAELLIFFCVYGIYPCTTFALKSATTQHFQCYETYSFLAQTYNKTDI